MDSLQLPYPVYVDMFLVAAMYCIVDPSRVDMWVHLVLPKFLLVVFWNDGYERKWVEQEEGILWIPHL